MIRPGFVLLALTLALPSCVAGAPEPLTRAANEPPPPPLSEIRSAAPAPGLVWVPGAWHDDGGKYVWVPGRWETPPTSTPAP